MKNPPLMHITGGERCGGCVIPIYRADGRLSSLAGQHGSEPAEHLSETSKRVAPIDHGARHRGAFPGNLTS